MADDSKNIVQRKYRSQLKTFKGLLKPHGQNFCWSRASFENGWLYYQGTIGDHTFYKREGKNLVRVKSSLDKNRFYEDQSFESSRKSAGRFAEGNRLASNLYKSVELEKRVYSLFCLLKKRAIQLIKEGKTVEQAENVLKEELRAS